MADEDGIGGASSSESFAEFRSLVEAADRKFARVRDLPPSARGPLHLLHFRKAFKAYTRLWNFQQQRRLELVAAGLERWEIGDVASRIGQLYYGQYQRTSEVRFLFEAYAPDLRLRYKELRFLVRFLIIALLLNRNDEAMNFKEWKQVAQEISSKISLYKGVETTRCYIDELPPE